MRNSHDVGAAASTAGSEELRARHAQVMPAWLTLYYDEPIELVRGEGTRVWDSAGREYLDFFAGILTTISGHAVPELTQVLHGQADRLNHTSSAYLIRPMIELAERMAELAPIDPPVKAFFTPSGSEAIDAALLFVTTLRQSNEVVALRNSYHGRSFAAMSITGQRGWSASSLSPFQVSYTPEPYCFRCPFGLKYPSCDVACAEDLRNVLETTTSGRPAALIAEPIQGVGGIVTPPPEYFKIVKSILDDFEVPLISDEVQTGFGRTGDSFWGIEGYGVRPDAIVVAKGLGNGLAIGGVVAKAELVDSLRANHISTFGGSPLTSSYAAANVDFIVDNDLQGNARRIGRLLWDGLKPLEERTAIVGELRGKGLMLGIELVDPADGRTPNAAAAATVMERARERGLLIGKGGRYGNVLRVTPPLTVSEDDAGRAIEILTAVIGEQQ